MDKYWHKGTIHFKSSQEKTPINIISEGLIASKGTGDGRFIPLIIIDTINRPDIKELIKVHRHTSFGDVACLWSQQKVGNKEIFLILNFLRPIELSIVIEFDIDKHGAVVNQILTSYSVYLQSGIEGDRLSSTTNEPKILLEIPTPEFNEEWKRIYTKFIISKFRKMGLNRKSAKSATIQFFDELEKMNTFRMK